VTDPPSSVRPRSERAVPALAAAAFLVAVVFAFWARGLAGDEEAVHFLLARFAFLHPADFLDLAGRPLPTLLYALPAQLGFLGARIAAALATGVAAWAVARLFARAGWLPVAWAPLLLLVQPFYLALSGTAMTEPAAAALVAWGLVAFAERRLGLLTAVATLLPLARPETLVFWPVVGIVLWREGRGGLGLVLPLGVVIWGILGGAAHADPLWLLHQTEGPAYALRGPLHYVKSLVWVLGLGTAFPIFLGFLGRLADGVFAGRSLPGSPADLRARAEAASAVTLVLLVAVYTLLAGGVPATGGNLRYLAVAAPAAAALAAAGLQRLAARRSPTAPALVLYAAGSILLWNHPYLGDYLRLARAIWLPALAAALWLVLYGLPRGARRWGPVLVLALAVTGLARFHGPTLHLVPTAEERATEAAANWLRDTGSRVPVYAAHPLLAFHLGADPHDATRFPAMSGVETAPPGALLFWDSHYAPAPAPGLTLPRLYADSVWIYRAGFAAPDTTWAGGFFARSPASGIPNGASGGVYGPFPVSTWLILARNAEAGVAFARRAAHADPRNPDRWRELAGRLAAAGRPTGVRAAIDHARTLDPGNPADDLLLADLLRRTGHLDQSLEAAQNGLAVHHDNGELELAMGTALSDLGRSAEAREHFLRAASLLPDRWDAQYIAGRIYRGEGKWKEAERYFRKALELEHRDPRPALYAAEAAVHLNRPGEAETLLRKLVARHPDLAEGYAALGDVLAAEGREQDARRVWREGLDRTGDTTLASRLKASAP
jgi:Flp pilus assembly protein TadD